MDSTRSQDSAHGGGSRKPKKPPMQFMFIDSTSGHGVNAKPDKAVRSFVMKTARNQKPWSTRQKLLESPPLEAETNLNSRPGPIRSHYSLDHRSTNDGALAASPSWPEYDPPLSASTAQSERSPVSSRSGSFYFSRNDSVGYPAAQSSHVDVCDAPKHGRDLYDQAHEAHTALRRRDGFSVGFSKSFDCLAVPLDAKQEGLVHHFVNCFLPVLLPIDLRQASRSATMHWVASSLQSATSAPFIYAALAASSQFQALGNSSPATVLHYKANAVSAIRELLPDPVKSVEDPNITAVLMLLSLEESKLAPGSPGVDETYDDPGWSEEQRQYHLNGLKLMIQKRGGLATLNSNKCLQTFLLMHSMAHAISSFERPYTVLLDGNGKVQKYDIPSFRSRPSSARTLRLFRDLKLDSSLFEIINDTAVFVGDITSWYDNSPCPLNPVDLQKHVSLLQYRCFDWVKQGEEFADVLPEKRIERAPVDQSVGLCLLIFLFIISNPVQLHRPEFSYVVLQTVRRLRAALSSVSIFRWAKSPDLLLWVLTLGALGARDSAESDFFAQKCRLAFSDQGYDVETNSDELMERMRKCLWVPGLMDAVVKRLWAEIGLCKGEDDDGEDSKLRRERERVKSPEIKDEYVVGLATNSRFGGQLKR